ncbi:uncharacterized protein EI90DRAFT_771978 [Cantharellus anzutake]|uniref:uncharacterized protein n=1 Tax=Cantharellus anzutake TaxID=1750568 RepID=UPI00190755A9|nr:uncharacterized protein EI90DRAFT_771978 [Cantharellus anzutake]KAF8342646.1 hypothetical protein EI90DRAFT_771978 [Cantharellus anzutake]
MHILRVRSIPVSLVGLSVKRSPRSPSCGQPSAAHNQHHQSVTMSRPEYNGPISYGNTPSVGIVPSAEDQYAPTYGGVTAGGVPTSPAPQQHQLYYGVPQAPGPIMYVDPQPQYYPAAPVLVGWTANGYVGSPSPQAQAQSPPPPTYGAKEAGWKIPSGGANSVEMNKITLTPSCFLPRYAPNKHQCKAHALSCGMLDVTPHRPPSPQPQVSIPS